MFFLENNTTFSGADIKVYAYRNPSDFSKYADLDEKKLKKNNTNLNFPDNPFLDMEAGAIDLELAKGLEGLTSPTGEVKQKIIKRTSNDPSFDGVKEVVVDAEDAQEVENAHAAPVFKDLDREYKATFHDSGEKTYTGAEGKAELDRLILERQQENLHRIMMEGITGVPAKLLSVPIVDELEPMSEVTYADGTTETVTTDKTYDISQNHTYATSEETASRTNYEAIQTNKVNPNYIDIVKTGGDKQALDLARKYQLAKINKNRNEIHDEAGNGTGRNKPIIELGSLYSITYSSFREKHAVRTLGRVSAKDYTRGQRTIAGSMNFAIFQSHELMDFLKTGPNAKQIVLLDQLPKFNLMFIMINEYGGASILHLFNVTISTESQQTSVDDLALMNQVTFYAEDIMTIENVGNIFETSLSMLHPTIIAGKTLRFYDKNDYTTLGSLMSINNSEDGKKDGKINSLLSRSRGLF